MKVMLIYFKSHAGTNERFGVRKQHESPHVHPLGLHSVSSSDNTNSIV